MRLFFNVLLIFSRSRLCHIKGQNNILKAQVLINRNVAPLTTINRKMTEPSTSENFKGNLDRFNGITVHSEAEACSVSQFDSKLENSLEQWKSEGRRGIWFRVHLEQTEWVPILAKKGFRFHHAKDDFVMMYLWLPTTETCNIPPYAHTMVGVGAVVVNDKSQVLVVSEKYYHVPHWKLPGGYVEPCENLVDAAIREVWEETGVQTEFLSLISLRQAHHGMFGCSDIYTIVSLKPLSTDIVKCEREIDKCQWMDIEEFRSHPNVHELNRFFIEKYLEMSKKGVKIEWHHGVHQVLQKPYTVYYVKTENNKL